MGKIIFILGGARSGKSKFAMKLANQAANDVAFIATCQPKDREMGKRIGLHKKNRPSRWKTFEEPLSVSSLLKTLGDKYGVILLDCITLLVSNLLLKGSSEKRIESEINKILSELKKKKAKCMVVSNEVGLGIVPLNKLARDFRDIAGRMNQLFAEKSDKVFFIASGIPWRIK